MKEFVTNKINSIKNEYPRYLIQIIWLLVNLILFIYGYVFYRDSLEYFYLRKFVSNGLSISRASALCLNFNCSVLLLLVCRNFLSYTRNILCLPTNIIRVVDKHVTFHRQIGYIIIFFSALHTLGHIHNLEMFVQSQNIGDPNKIEQNSDIDIIPGLLSTLSSISGRYYINPVRYSNSVPNIECIKLASGITGLVMIIALSIIASSSSEYIRRSFYNLFWYVHQVVALVFFIGFVTHGIQGIIRKQINLDKHDPQFCYRYYSSWPTEDRRCDIPKFSGSAPTSYIWVIFSFLVYIFERLVRFFRSLRTHKIEIYKMHPSNVLELRILNKDVSNKINYKAGQYVYLNFSSLSYFEWHPFTITSGPYDKYLTVHIRNAGDWTNTLIKNIESSDNMTPNIKDVSIDGPYGTCAEDISKYEHLILIGAGIGVTPYASILKNVSYKLRAGEILLKKIHFFWICPSIDTFEWFGELLQTLELEMKNKNRADLVLEYKIYLTRGWSLKEAKEIVNNDSETYDLFTGLNQKTNYGRPNFDLFFKDYSSMLNESELNEKMVKVGVFFCGPQQLSTQLHNICNLYSNDKLRFFYNKENF